MEPMELRRLLVTGGAGFIGSHFVRHWLRTRPQDQVIVLDALTYAGNLANLADCREQCQFVVGDINGCCLEPWGDRYNPRLGKHLSVRQSHGGLTLWPK